MLWKGGMAFHGGLLGVILGAYLYYRKTYTPFCLGPICWPWQHLWDCCWDALPIYQRRALGAQLIYLGASFSWVRPHNPVVKSWAYAHAIHHNCEALLEGLLLGAVLIYLAFHKGALKRPGFVCGTFSSATASRDQSLIDPCLTRNFPLP